MFPTPTQMNRGKKEKTSKKEDSLDANHKRSRIEIVLFIGPLCPLLPFVNHNLRDYVKSWNFHCRKPESALGWLQEKVGNRVFVGNTSLGVVLCPPLGVGGGRWDVWVGLGEEGRKVCVGVLVLELGSLVPFVSAIL